MDSLTVVVVIVFSLVGGSLLVACGILGPEWLRWLRRWITSRARGSR